MSKEVFISHSSKNFKEAKKICDCLEKKNIECFIAPRDLTPGQIYGEEIVRGIDECNKFILIASKDAFESQHVLREVERAVNSNMKIYVYKIEDVEVPKSFEYFIMLSQWIDASFTSKIDDLANIIKEEDKKEAENKAAEDKINANESPDSDAGNKADNSDSISGNASGNKIADAHLSKNSQNNKSDSKKAIIGIVTAIALIIVIAIVVIFNKNSNNDKTKNDNKKSDVSENVNAKDNDNNKNNVEDVNNDNSDKNVSKDTSDCKVGDIITMGTYNGKPIEWIVLNIDDKGNKYILAKDSISIKAYDSAESGEWNKINDTTEFERDKEAEYSDEELINAKGSNDWSTSNIRIWLNSQDKKVKYEGNSPDSKAFYDSRIAYDKEEGFLNAFTEDEINKIVETNGDYVFLPSVEEVNDYIINGDVIFPEAEVTKEALDADRTGEVSALTSEYGGKFPWFTRTKSDDGSYKVVCVFSEDYSTDGTPFYAESVGTPRGIRPAMVIK